MLPHVTLTVVEGPHQGQTLVCPDWGVVTIGRSNECPFCLCGEAYDLLVSRRHCQIESLWNGVEIRDLESRNGTYVNGRRIGFAQNGEPTDAHAAFKLPLKDGDEIQIGNSVIQVKLAPVPAENSEWSPHVPSERMGGSKDC
jgi:pSer/pThr/pTyr-binding forkhead associated (FHA) protein